MRTVFAALFATVVTTPALAQITVQQPVIGTIGGSFSVIVPDRGATFLGGVSSAGDSRSSVGLPFLRGSSIGQFRNHRSMWAHSRIIDLREMDRLVLQAAETGIRPEFAARYEVGSQVGIAYTDLPSYRSPAIRENDRSARSSSTAIEAIAAALRNRSSTQRFANSRTTAASNRPTAQAQRRSGPTTVSRALDPARNYQLGLEAERAGRVSLAKLHYRTAAQHGSVFARQRLEQLSQQATIASK